MRNSFVAHVGGSFPALAGRSVRVYYLLEFNVRRRILKDVFLARASSIAGTGEHVGGQLGLSTSSSLSIFLLGC